MIIEIDQSGKVEETAKDTVVAFSNGIKRSILLPKREKRKLQRFFRKLNRPRNYNYQVFATLIFILIRKYARRLDRIIIDVEYMGKNVLIRALLAQKMRAVYKDFDDSIIVFQQIGKKSPAHDVAYFTYMKEKKPTIKVNAKEVLGTIIRVE
jgi:hypothetical protein